jgi:hypothetical protein
MLTGRPAFPRLQPFAFGLAFAVTANLVPGWAPLLPDTLLVIPIAIVGTMAGWILLRITSWRTLAATTSTMTGISILCAARSNDEGGSLLLLSPVVVLAVIVWVPERRDPPESRPPAAPSPAPVPGPRSPDDWPQAGMGGGITGRTCAATTGGPLLEHLAESAPAIPERDRIPAMDVLAGRWELRADLPGADSGGFSLIHLAADRLDPGQRLVAKLPDPNRREQARARLAREQEMLQRCHSPRVVRPVDAGVDPATGRLYLILPWYRDGSLNAYLASATAFQLGWVLAIADDLLAALVHLHDEQPEPIVHRDLNPRNVLLNGGRAVLCDFGSARYLTRLDDTITLAGPPYSRWYAAPELPADTGAWSQATDLYGVAAVTYELVTGLPPYRREHFALGRDFEKLAAAGVPPMTAAQVNPRLPAALSSVLEHCLAPDPAARPTRAVEVRAALAPVRAASRLLVPYQTLRGRG